MHKKMARGKTTNKKPHFAKRKVRLISFHNDNLGIWSPSQFGFVVLKTNSRAHSFYLVDTPHYMVVAEKVSWSCIGLASAGLSNQDPYFLPPESRSFVLGH